MTRRWVLILTLFALTAAAAVTADAQSIGNAKVVVVRNGSATLHALLWRPQGRGPFPAVLFNHGSGRTPEDLARLGPYEPQAEILGPVFARHGYEFMYLFRRGVGLSADQGVSAIDLMTGERAWYVPPPALACGSGPGCSAASSATCWPTANVSSVSSPPP